MKRYRFYEIQGGEKFYLTADKKILTTTHSKAGLFDEKDWNTWGYGDGFEREELGEDEQMRRAGAPMLPGMEE